MKNKKSVIAIVMAVIMCSLMIGVPSVDSEAAGSARLNKTSVVISAGKTFKLKLFHNKKKVTWSSSKKSVATVSQKGKVTAKKKGTAYITAKVAKKKYKCKVRVKGEKKAEYTTPNEADPTTAPIPSATPTPTATPKPAATATPTPVATPLTVTAARQKLAGHISSYGTNNSDGNKEIRYSYGTDTVYLTYDSAKKTVKMDEINITKITTGLVKGYTGVSSVYIELPLNGNTITPTYTGMYLNASDQIVGIALMKTNTTVSNVKPKNSFRWTVTSNTGIMEGVDETKMGDLANTTLNLWYATQKTYLLLKDVGITLTDLGFGS